MSEAEVANLPRQNRQLNSPCGRKLTYSFKKKRNEKKKTKTTANIYFQVLFALLGDVERCEWRKGQFTAVRAWRCDRMCWSLVADWRGARLRFKQLGRSDVSSRLLQLFSFETAASKCTDWQTVSLTISLCMMLEQNEDAQAFHFLYYHDVLITTPLN